MTTISTRFAIAAATLVAGIGISGAAVAQGDESRATERSGSTTTPAETPPDPAGSGRPTSSTASSWRAPAAPAA